MNQTQKKLSLLVRLCIHVDGNCNYGLIRDFGKNITHENRLRFN